MRRDREPSARSRWGDAIAFVTRVLDIAGLLPEADRPVHHREEPAPAR